jgi:hypothetical protein
MLAAVIAFERTAAKESDPELRMQKSFSRRALAADESELAQASANDAGARLHDFSHEGENRVYFAWGSRASDVLRRAGKHLEHEFDAAGFAGFQSSSAHQTKEPVSPRRFAGTENGSRTPPAAERQKTF